MWRNKMRRVRRKVIVLLLRKVLRYPIPSAVWHHWDRKFWVIFAVLLLVSYIVGHQPAVGDFGRIGFDRWQKLSKEPDASHVVYFAIEETQHREWFKGRTPLDPDCLGKIIQAVADLGPAVIAVDILTHHEDFREKPVINPRWPPVVWARSAEMTPEGIPLNPLPILGNRGGERIFDGLALVPVDWDRTIRRYDRMGKYKDGREFTMFHWEVARRYCALGKFDCPPKLREAATSDTVQNLNVNVLNESYNVHRIPVGYLGACDATPVKVKFNKGSVLDKIAIIGGEYAAARDLHRTPRGPRYGGRIVAEAVETELVGGGIKPVNDLLLILVKIILGLLLASCYHYLRPVAALTAVTLGMASMTLAGSFLVYYIWSYWADFVPFLLGVWLEQLYEQTHHIQKLEAGVHSDA
jgi:CHASE2 domain-containing sensor protein